MANPRARRPPDHTAGADQIAWGLLLAPGASASKDQSALVEIDHAASAVGGKVRRMDFPYRAAGRRAPDKPEVLVRAVVEEAGGAGGRSPVAA